MHHPGATYIALHFDQFALAFGDVLVVSSPDDPQVFELRGKGLLDRGRFWAIHTYGDTAYLELRSRGRPPNFGFVIDKYSAGIRQEDLQTWGPESLCGGSQLEHVICKSAEEGTAYDRSRAVARLLTHHDFRDEGEDSFCTGFLVYCSGKLLTNHHCVPGQAQASATIAEFMAEAPSCNDPNPPEGLPPQPATDPPYPGDRVPVLSLDTTDAPLDYSLLRLPGFPHLTYGSFALEGRQPIPDERIYIAHHPSGRAKNFGMESDYQEDESGLCEIDDPAVPSIMCAGQSATNATYGCDIEVGSSGAPVVAYSSHRVLVMNHCSGVCPNYGTRSVDFFGPLVPFLGTPIEAVPGEVPHWQPEPLRLSKPYDAPGTGNSELKLDWGSTAEALFFNSYRGTIPAALQPWAYDHLADSGAGIGACDIGGINDRTHTDSDDLLIPGSFYYLVTGENACAEGPTGYDSAGVRRPDGTGCP